ncbi:hypothetical protein QO189_07320 [Psychrobacter sp. Arc29]|uniref:hypothetical protein n=1 Tax=Psychrobacter sp. Arc29 TaxID=3046690 RepID=UPI00352FBA4F
MIKLYIYSLLDNRFLYEDTGSIDVILSNLGNDKDFVLTPPPDYDQQWYWMDDKWTTEPAK